MAEERKKVSCGDHGEATATYVCEHLVSAPHQKWFCAYPAEADPWPDAWCAACNQLFQQEGEWNEKNSVDLSAKLICHLCYEAAIAESVERLDENQRKLWEESVKNCSNELREKQDQLEAEFSLFSHTRYDWDQETATLTFSSDGIPAVVANIQFVGSISTQSDTWLWSWGNFSFSPPVREKMIDVRSYGEVKGFPRLTVPKWTAEEVDGWEMSAIAVHVLNARGAYRAPVDYGYAFMIITDLSVVQ